MPTKREAARDAVIRAVALVIQCEYGGWTGPAIGTNGGDEDFREAVEDTFEAACREYVAVLDERKDQS
jgi:hypothetical protein